MPGKNVTLSVRLDESDAHFLERLRLADAETPSEKLRAIIGHARQREEGKHSYHAGLRLIDDLLDPVRMAVLDQQRREGTHSELISRVYEWLPDLLAFVLASVEQELDSDEMISLEELEAGIADRVFRIIAATLRLGLSSTNPCIDSKAVSKRLPPILELTQLLSREVKGNA